MWRLKLASGSDTSNLRMVIVMRNSKCITETHSAVNSFSKSIPLFLIFSRQDILFVYQIRIYKKGWLLNHSPDTTLPYM